MTNHQLPQCPKCPHLQRFSASRWMFPRGRGQHTRFGCDFIFVWICLMWLLLTTFPFMEDITALFWRNDCITIYFESLTCTPADGTASCCFACLSNKSSRNKCEHFCSALGSCFLCATVLLCNLEIIQIRNTSGMQRSPSSTFTWFSHCVWTALVV